MNSRNFALNRRLALRYLGYLVNETRLPHPQHQKVAGQLAATLVAVGEPLATIEAILSKTVHPVVPFEVTHRTLEQIPDKSEVMASFALSLFEADKSQLDAYERAVTAIRALPDGIKKADYLACLYSPEHDEIALEVASQLATETSLRPVLAEIEIGVKLAERGNALARDKAKSAILALSPAFADRAGAFLVRLGKPEDIALAKAMAETCHPPYKIWAALVTAGDAETITKVKALSPGTDIERSAILPMWLAIAATESDIHAKLLAQLSLLDANKPRWFELLTKACLLFPEASFANVDNHSQYLAKALQKNNITEVQPIALLNAMLTVTKHLPSSPSAQSHFDLGFSMDLTDIIHEADELKKLQLLRGFLDRDSISNDEAAEIQSILLPLLMPKKGRAVSSPVIFEQALDTLFALAKHSRSTASVMTHPSFTKASSGIEMPAEHKDILYSKLVRFRDEKSFSFGPQQLCMEYSMQATCKDEVALRILLDLSESYYLEGGLSDCLEKLQSSGWSVAQCVQLIRYVYHTHHAVPEPAVLMAFADKIDLNHDVGSQLLECSAYFKALYCSLAAKTPYLLARQLTETNISPLRMAYYLEHIGKQVYMEVANYSFAKFSKQALITASAEIDATVIQQYASACEAAGSLPKAKWHRILSNLVQGIWPMPGDSHAHLNLTSSPKARDKKFTIAYIPAQDLMARFRFADGVGSCLVSRNKMRHIDMTYMAMSPFSANFTIQNSKGITVGFITCTLGLMNLPDGTQEPTVIANQLYCTDTEARSNPASELSELAHQWIQDHYASAIGAKHYLVAYQDYIGRESIGDRTLVAADAYSITQLVPLADTLYRGGATIRDIHYDYGEKANTSQTPQAGKVYAIALSPMSTATAPVSTACCNTM